jgi:hypothetical protein
MILGLGEELDRDKSWSWGDSMDIDKVRRRQENTQRSSLQSASWSGDEAKIDIVVWHSHGLVLGQHDVGDICSEVSTCEFRYVVLVYWSGWSVPVWQTVGARQMRKSLLETAVPHAQLWMVARGKVHNIFSRPPFLSNDSMSPSHRRPPRHCRHHQGRQYRGDSRPKIQYAPLTRHYRGHSRRRLRRC